MPASRVDGENELSAPLGGERTRPAHYERIRDTIHVSVEHGRVASMFGMAQPDGKLILMVLSQRDVVGTYADRHGITGAQMRGVHRGGNNGSSGKFDSRILG